MAKILYISYDGAMDPLGRSQVKPYLAGLSGKGHAIYLVTFEKRVNLLFRDSFLCIQQEFYKNGIRWYPLCYHKIPKLLAALYDVTAGYFKCARIIKKERINIVHARGYMASLIAFLLKKSYRFRFIFDIRGFWPDEKVDAGAWKRDGLVYKIFKSLEKKFFGSAERVVVLSEKGKELLEKIYGIGSKTSFMPTCVDLGLFSIKDSKVDKERFVFLYSGSLGTWYMLEEMVDFFKEAAGLFNPALFMFLNNNDSGHIAETMRLKGIPAESYSVKTLEYRQVADYMNIAEVSVFFIKPVFSKIFSCPTKFNESLACGLPVVINSGIGDTDKVVRQERVGIVIDEFSQGAYRKAAVELRRLLLEGDILRRRCRSVAERYFSLRYGIEKYDEIYKKISEAV